MGKLARMLFLIICSGEGTMVYFICHPQWTNSRSLEHWVERILRSCLSLLGKNLCVRHHLCLILLTSFALASASAAPVHRWGLIGPHFSRLVHLLSFVQGHLCPFCEGCLLGLGWPFCQWANCWDNPWPWAGSQWLSTPFLSWIGNAEEHSTPLLRWSLGLSLSCPQQ